MNICFLLVLTVLPSFLLVHVSVYIMKYTSPKIFRDIADLSLCKLMKLDFSKKTD